MREEDEEAERFRHVDLSVEESAESKAWRDTIAQQMWEDYTSSNRFQ